MESFRHTVANDLAKGFLSGLGAINRFRQPYSGSIKARVQSGVPTRYNGNRQRLSELLTEGRKRINRGQSAKQVGNALHTSTQRLVGVKNTVAASSEPKDFGGSGFTCDTPRTLGQAPTQGYTTTTTTKPTVGVTTPQYINPVVTSQPQPSAPSI